MTLTVTGSAEIFAQSVMSVRWRDRTIDNVVSLLEVDDVGNRGRALIAELSKEGCLPGEVKIYTRAWPHPPLFSLAESAHQLGVRIVRGCSQVRNLAVCLCNV
jgi:hypothetical protein